MTGKTNSSSEQDGPASFSSSAFWPSEADNWEDAESSWEIVYAAIKNMLAGVGILAMFVLACFIYGYRS